MSAPGAQPPTAGRARVRGGAVGAAAGACAVCCAAPVAALLGIGLTGAAATAFALAFAGLVFALVVAGATVAAVILHRRARPDIGAATGSVGPVQVELGHRPDEPQPASARTGEAAVSNPTAHRSSSPPERDGHRTGRYRPRAWRRGGSTTSSSAPGGPG